MPIQTTYNINHDALYAGMLVESQPYSSFSKLNEGTTSIPFGAGVAVTGTSFSLPGATTTAADFGGVVKRELNRVHAGDDDGAISGQSGTVIGMGQIAVTVSTDVTARGPVFWGTGTANAGTFAAAADTSADNRAVAIPGAIFEKDATAGSIVNILLKIGG